MTILPGTTRGPTYAQVFAKGKAIRLLGGTSGYVDLVSPAAPTSHSLTLPSALAAVTGYVLSSTDAGVLSWVAQTPASSPAGSGTEIQYRNGSAFGAVAGSSWDATTLALPKLSAISTTANQLTVGYDSTYKVTLDVSAAGVMTLAGYKASGTNAAAGVAYIDVPVSTGSATPGKLIFRSTVADVGSSTAQTLGDTLTVTGLTIQVPVGSAASPSYSFHGYPGDGLYHAGGQIHIVVSSVSRFAVLSNKIRIGSAQTYSFSTGAAASSSDDAHILRLGPGKIGIGDGSVGNYAGTIIAANGGFGTSAPGRPLEVNAADGNCLRLTYNDADGSATSYTDFAVSAAGNLTITPSGGIAYLTGNLEPATDDTYYLGKNDDDTPKAWKGVILKDTTNGKWYRLEIISGVVTATDLTD